MNNAILALVSVCLIIVGAVVVWATRAPNELHCERNGVSGITTMHELRKPGPYVVLQLQDGKTIAIAKDGIRCERA